MEGSKIEKVLQLGKLLKEIVFEGFLKREWHDKTNV